MSIPRPNWAPFIIDNSVQVAPRPIFAPEFSGVGDRLRTAAFAEMQAKAAFLWASESFSNAHPDLRSAWRELAAQEDKHMGWLLRRMEDLKISISERAVSDSLWNSLVSCPSAKEFCHYIADAEERGRRAGVRFSEKLKEFDPISADIFGRIAEEERSHIELAHRFFPLA